ncbi:hypothetical protein JTB14_038036 [Gonioctena quinquepunctata]|nr:hypothetical protein JTB14_038036 [Gonioctena quinquepunctata]
MNYETEQTYLAELHAEFLSESEPEVEPDHDDSGDFEDSQDHDTDMEEDIEEETREIPGVLNVPQRVPHSIDKDGKTEWRKHVENHRIRTRAENIIKIKIPGVKATVAFLLN